MKIQNPHIVDLEHEVHLLGANSQPCIYVAASRLGEMSVLGDRLNLLLQHKHLGPITDLSVDPAGKMVSLARDKSAGLVVRRLDNGTVLGEITDQACEACRFDAVRCHLWCAARINRHKIKCELLDAPFLQILCQAIIPGDFGDSSGCIFSSVPQPDAMGLWLTDGQGASRLLWLAFGPGGLSWRIEPLMEDAYPPIFNDYGNEFLVNYGNVVRRYAYPAMQLLGSCPCTFDEEAFEPSLCFLSNKTALIRTSNGRLFTIKLETMTLGEEVLINGHEPKPARAFSSLQLDARLCTDIDTFQRLGCYVVMVCPREGHSFHRDSLLFCHIEEFNS